MRHLLERSTLIPKPRRQIFQFFADAHNLKRITPGFLRFHILTPDPIELRPGTHIDYELRLHGVPVRWRTLIEEFVPDEYFIDVQVSGPYRSWRHRHDFEQVPIGTRMRDRVEYELPFGFVGALAHSIFVKSALRKIFDHRNQEIQRFFT